MKKGKAHFSVDKYGNIENHSPNEPPFDQLPNWEEVFSSPPKKPKLITRIGRFWGRIIKSISPKS